MKKILLTAVALLTLSAGAIQAQKTGQICIVCPPNNDKEWIDVYKTKPDPSSNNFSTGDKIFVSDDKCILKYNGTSWNTLWYNEYPEGVAVVPPTTVDPGTIDSSGEGGGSVTINDDGTVTVAPGTANEVTCIPPPLRFMAHNLGANPKYNTPKKQMEYQNGTGNTALTDVATGDARDRDATVAGGLYQWGRKDLDYGSSEEYVRYRGLSTEGGAVSNSQTNDPNAATFYYGNPIWYNGSGDMKTFWGNGTDNQETAVKGPNDPCPNGYRVPTQYEWKSLLFYDCKPSQPHAGTFTINNGDASHDTGRGLTWVRVNKGYTSKDWTIGIAVYRTVDWNGADSGYRIPSSAAGIETFPATGAKALYEDGAPDPIIYLPIGGRRSYDNGYYLNGSNTTLGYYFTGTYWSSYYNGSKASFLEIDAASGGGSGYITVSTNKNTNPADGMSVRCVME